MNPDLTSLDRLHDLTMPPPVPWWPPGPGWLFLAGAWCLALGCWLMRAIWRWQRNCYRREALVLLEAAHLTGLELATLTKRVARTAYPRERVASLTGEPWLAFLNQTGQTDAFTRGSG